MEGEFAIMSTRNATNIPSGILNIGSGNYVAAHMVAGISKANSKPIKALMLESRTKSMLIDCTCGKAVKSFISTNAGYAYLSHLSPETLYERLSKCLIIILGNKAVNTG
jgi:regulator of extracellular matrix RemA (YlzA/DUF370 family)